ncbi:uncharacterized protein LOC108982319 isoform X2 [Juglans regia]|nr:uncharacterized protein LOC108982319 isoform X2 [Juglans regia]
MVFCSWTVRQSSGNWVLWRSKTNRRSLSWDLLSRVNPGPYPWCLFGDFNEIMVSSEKVGGRERPEFQMRRFREAVEHNNLIDVGCRGNPFIWSNRHLDLTFTKERLDRVFVNHLWQLQGARVVVDTLVAKCSDHTPLVVSLLPRDRGCRLHKRCFMFEASWTKENNCGRVIEDGWRNCLVRGSTVDRLQASLRKCSTDLSRWSRSNCSEEEKLLEEKATCLKRLQDHEGTDMLQREVGLLLDKQDLKWKQRAKANWYKVGDRNIRFFHMCASQRWRRNRIVEVRDSTDILRTGQDR